jgi:hypothetical protein
MALRMTISMTIKTGNCNAGYVMQKPINCEFHEIVSLLDAYFVTKIQSQIFYFTFGGSWLNQDVRIQCEELNMLHGKRLSK